MKGNVKMSACKKESIFYFCCVETIDQCSYETIDDYARITRTYQTPGIRMKTRYSNAVRIDIYSMH